jgi:hypothetical protein
MRRVKFRWLLPLGHALIDCILALAWIKFSDSLFRREALATPPPATIQAALLQEGNFDWVPVYDSIPGPFLVLASGTLPAGLLSDVFCPGAGLTRPGQRWRPIWFLLNEAFALACWWLIGRRADTGHLWMGRVMLAYLAARSLIALTGIYEVGWRIEVLFWWCFALWLLAVGIARSVRGVLRYARRFR